MNSSVAGELKVLARRSIARGLRQPTLLLPSTIFPVFILAVLSSAASQATKVAGFPKVAYITFLLGATMVQVAANATTVAGNLLATDIETGFLNRMLLTPVRRWPLIVAQLASVLLIGAVQLLVVLAAGLIGGASVKAGVGGAAALIGLALLFVLMFGALGLLAAVLTGSAAQTQALFPVFLSLMFMSSMLMPRNLISAGWFKAIATYNPMSYLVEGTRSFLVTGWDGRAIALGGGIALFGLVLALGGCVITMRKRLVRA